MATPARAVPHGLAFAPTKIGVLIDMDMGTKDDFLACLRMTFDEAHADGTITRPVELVVKEAIGLPRLEAKNTIDGYRELVEHGVLCTIGPLITDNSIALAPVIDRTGVPAITWTGTDRYFGDYCFNLGNGGLAEEAAIMATWIRRSGYRTVGMIHEISPGGVEYASNFRWYAAKEKLDVLIEAYTTQVPDDLEGVLKKIRDQKPDCLAYLGYGYPTILMAPMFERLGWNPPRVMTTAFQFCYAKPEWMAALEGWVGVDQWCEDNPLAEPVFDRFAAATGKSKRHTVLLLTYDTARLVAEGLARANLLTPKGVKEGLEKVRMLPAANGGPRTHMSLGPYDHKAYKGDWLVLRKIENGRTVWVDLHDPVKTTPPGR
jgi:ABC-type branched-subunit amino acid transport system substrate-binding protein